MHLSEKLNTTTQLNSQRTPLKILYRTLTVLCLIMAPTYCLAFPYLDNLRVLKDKWNKIAYTKIVWPTEESTTSVCNSSASCSFGPCIKRGLIIGGDVCGRDMDDSYVDIPYGTTMIQARQLWINKYGTISRDIRFKRADEGAADAQCITFQTGFSNNTPIPGMQCYPLPPANITCTIADQLNISYNTLTADKVNNAEAYGTLNVLCSGWTSVRLQLVGLREIDLGRAGTLTASLHIEGKDLANSYSFQGFGQTTSLKVTSILHSSRQEAEAGSFQGQGIIIMQIN